MSQSSTQNPLSAKKSDSNPSDSPPANPNNLWEFLFRLITTKQGWLGITGIVAIVTAAVLITIHFMRPDQIEITTGVGTISIKKGNTQNAWFSLSPTGGDENTPWAKTGIMVKKGDLIKITANGRVHTSIRRLIAEAMTPEIDEQSWASPSGLSRSQDPPSFLPQRDRHKLLPDKNGAYYGFGMLLAAVRDDKQQIKEDDIEPIGENRQFTAKTDGELVLTVNDIWLDKEDKDVYAPPLNQEENFKYYLQNAYFQAALKGEDFNLWSKETERQKVEKQYQKRLKSWELVVKNNNWSIWYDDNMGSFSVSINVKEKE
jgi:hypothetical protein